MPTSQKSSCRHQAAIGAAQEVSRTKEGVMMETFDRLVEPCQPAAVVCAMLDVNQVAALLNCSARHVYRLADAGRMPRPVKLGALVRWPRHKIEAWIEDGCPSCRSPRWSRP